MKENQIPTTYSSLNFFIFLSLQFSNIKKFISLFSGTERHTKLKLGPHMDSRLMYHVYLNQAAGVYLFLYFFNFFSLKFQNIKFFITLFCKAYKVATWHTHGQIVDLLCTPTTSSQNILVPLFFFFFLSLQWAKIKKLLLQNCFNIPMMARPGVCELCPLSAIFFFLTNSKTLIFCHTFLWVVQSWNLIHTWAKHWSVVYTKYK